MKPVAPSPRPDHHHRRRRMLVRLGLFVLAGAIVNVAVAWGLYLWRPFEGHPFQATTASEAQSVWDRAWPPGTRFANDGNRTHYDPQGQFTATPGYRIIFVGHGPSQQGQTQWRDGSAWEFRAGWPAASLVAHKWHFDDSNHGLLVIKDSWIPIRKKGSPIMDDYLPYCPSWPGFAINMVFYASILWLVFVAPFVMRRRLRLRLGRCPNCAYPVGQSPVCTECGKPVAAPPRREPPQPLAPGSAGG